MANNPNFGSTKFDEHGNVITIHNGKEYPQRYAGDPRRAHPITSCPFTM